MILWTIQSEAFFEKLKTDGRVVVSGSDFIDKDFRPAYEWMVEQMVEHIGGPPEENVFPIWAWYQWEGVGRKRPDLRSGGLHPRGEKGVRIEFECSEADVLLSDFDLWHHVLNYFYLPESEEDHDKFDLMFKDEKSFNRSKFDKMVVKSWERIFDLDWHDPYISWPREEKSVQATFWELRINQVRDFKYFVAR